MLKHRYIMCTCRFIVTVVHCLLKRVNCLNYLILHNYNYCHINICVVLIIPCFRVTTPNPRTIRVRDQNRGSQGQVLTHNFGQQI